MWFPEISFIHQLLLQSKNILLVHGDFRPFLFIVVIYHIWSVFCQSWMFSRLYAFLLLFISCILFYEPTEIGFEHKFNKKTFL